MNTTHKQQVAGFIEDIWNTAGFEKLSTYLHESFTDHSLPPGFPPDRNGLQQWVEATGRSFRHRTVIDDLVSEGHKVMVKIRMELTHTGLWRGIEPTHKEITANGYRFFLFSENRIISHWGLIDGNAIENQLKETAHGCKLREE